MLHLRQPPPGVPYSLSDDINNYPDRPRIARARMLVNDILDRTTLGVEERQRVNDECDQLAYDAMSTARLR